MALLALALVPMAAVAEHREALLMFIGSPGDHFLYGLAELGGVRLII